MSDVSERGSPPVSTWLGNRGIIDTLIGFAADPA